MTLVPFRHPYLRSGPHDQSNFEVDFPTRMSQERAVSNIMQEFLGQFQKKFGSFPNDYLAGDTETSGVDKASDLILQLGYCTVEDGKAVERKSFLLNWPDSGLVDEYWLRERMEQTRQHVEFKNSQPTGKRYHFTYDGLRAGEPPIAVIKSFYDLLMDYRAAGLGFVFHNGYAFDGKMLTNHFKRWLGKDWDFADNELWDTGMIEKGSQINSVPDKKDTLKSFCMRVAGGRFKGVFWSLDQHCCKRYNLAEKHGLDMSSAHDGGFDAYVCHLLFEEYKEIAKKENVDPNQPPF